MRPRARGSSTSGEGIGYSQTAAGRQTGWRAIRDMLASRKSLVEERHAERRRWNGASGGEAGEGRGMGAGRIRTLIIAAAG